MSAAIIVIAIVGLFLSTKELTYQYPVAEVLEKKAEMRGRFRVEGNVIRGSITQKPGTMQYWFQVGSTPFDRSGLPVLFTGAAPDNFKNDAEVVVTGRFRADGTFVSTEMLAKCPSRYAAKGPELDRGDLERLATEPAK